MISKIKKYIIMLLQLPLTFIGIFVKMTIALLSFAYIRWVRKGIHQGKQLHTFLETHEQGYIKPRKGNR